MTNVILSSIPKALIALGLPLSFADSMQLENEVDGDSFPVITQEFVDQSLDPYAYSEKNNLHRRRYFVLQKASAPKTENLFDPTLNALFEARQEVLANLNSLNLSGNYTVPLKKLEHTPNLTSLDLSDRDIGDEGIKYIVKLKTLNNLQSLSLRGSNISAKGIESITQARYLSNLTFLDVSYNNFGNQGASYIATSPTFTRLMRLDMNQCGITEAGGNFIAASTTLINLISLNARYNRFSLSAIKSLWQEPTFCNLTHLNVF